MKRFKVFVFSLSPLEKELLEEELFSFGCLGIEEVNEREVKAYFPEEISLPTELEGRAVKVYLLESRDWNEEWKKHFKPVRVSERIFVVPSWMKDDFQVPEGALAIYIYPGKAFGTGTHETTKLSMRLIEEALKPKDSFLDVGIGSGILSILAKKLGAGKVVGCDVEDVREEVELNSSLNGVSGIEVINGSVDKVDGKFDVVVANIEKHILEPLLPSIKEKALGWVILSGILKVQRDGFVNSLSSLGFKVVKELEEGEWKAFLCRK